MKNYIKICFIVLYELTILCQTCARLNCDCYGLNVVSLNIWGLSKFTGFHDGSQYKPQRILAISDLVAKGDYDIFLLQEVWQQKDHNIIASKLPNGYHITGFRDFSHFKCDGIFTPIGCSGLAIISKYEMIEVEFKRFSYLGHITKLFIDGEVAVKKGIGRIRIEPIKDFIVDVFVTHMISDPNISIYGYNNSLVREKQVEELLISHVDKSNADLIIVGGDFNFEPEESKGTKYRRRQKFPLTYFVQYIVST